MRGAQGKCTHEEGLAHSALAGEEALQRRAAQWLKAGEQIEGGHREGQKDDEHRVMR